MAKNFLLIIELPFIERWSIIVSKSKLVINRVYSPGTIRLILKKPFKSVLALKLVFLKNTLQKGIGSPFALSKTKP